MVMGLRKIQIGSETTTARGTAVAATRVLFGTMTMTPTLALHIPEDEERNSLSMAHRSTIVGQHEALTFNSNLDFENVPYFLAMGITGDASPTGGTSANGRTWIFTKNTTARNWQDSYTVEYGDDNQEYEATFVLAEQLEFTYAMGEPVTMSATMFGRLDSTGTFTSLTEPDNVETAVTAKTTMYSDTAWANLGNTTTTNTLVNAVVRIPTGLQRTKYADGSLDFSGFSESKYSAEVELTLVHNTFGQTALAEYRNQNLRFLRLETLGSTLGSTSALTHTFRIDMAFKYTEPPQLFTDQNGENTIVLRGRSFDDTAGNELIVTAICDTTGIQVTGS